MDNSNIDIVLEDEIEVDLYSNNEIEVNIFDAVPIGLSIEDEMRMIDLAYICNSDYYTEYSDQKYSKEEIQKIKDLIKKLNGGN